MATEMQQVVLLGVASSRWELVQITLEKVKSKYNWYLPTPQQT